MRRRLERKLLLDRLAVFYDAIQETLNDIPQEEIDHNDVDVQIEELLLDGISFP